MGSRKPWGGSLCLPVVAREKIEGTDPVVQLISLVRFLGRTFYLFLSLSCVCGGVWNRLFVFCICFFFVVKLDFVANIFLPVVRCGWEKSLLLQVEFFLWTNVVGNQSFPGTTLIIAAVA